MSFKITIGSGLLLLGFFVTGCVSNEVTFPTKTPATRQACLGASIAKLYEQALNWRDITGLDPATIDVNGNSLPPEEMRRFFYITETSRRLDTAIAQNKIPPEKAKVADTFNHDVYVLALYTIGAKRDGECTCVKTPTGTCGVLEGISR